MKTLAPPHRRFMLWLRLTRYPMPVALRLSAKRPRTAVEVQFEDGRYFVRTENVTALDGSAPKFFAFIAFDNMTKAKTFNDSMKDTTALRTRVTNSRSFIVEGTSQ